MAHDPRLENYLNSLERSLQPLPISDRAEIVTEIKSHVLKWIVVGFLGTLAIILAFVGFMVSHFSPLLHVDEQSGHVSILGGLIDIEKSH